MIAVVTWCYLLLLVVVAVVFGSCLVQSALMSEENSGLSLFSFLKGFVFDWIIEAAIFHDTARGDSNANC